MDLYSIISYQPRHHPLLNAKKCLSFWGAYYHLLVMTSVQVLLPPSLPYLTRRKTQITNLLSLPEAVLIKAFNSIDRVHRGGLVGGR